MTVFDKDDDEDDEDDEEEKDDEEMIEEEEEDDEAAAEKAMEMEEDEMESTSFDYDLLGIKERLMAVVQDEETVDQNKRKVDVLYKAYQDFCPLDEDDSDMEGEANEEEDEDEA